MRSTEPSAADLRTGLATVYDALQRRIEIAAQMPEVRNRAGVVGRPVQQYAMYG